MAFDYKKEYREFYMPPSKPGIITVPSMNYIAVRGQGDPNAEEGEYKQSIGLLYGIAFTIKMSQKGDPSDRRVFRLCRAAARRLLVAGWRKRDRLCPKGKLQVDIGHPSSGLCDKSRFRVGNPGSNEEKENRFCQG